MSEQQSPQVSLKKQPKQARSAELIESILEAATQVLAAEGARRFTTARVAERAGVSVGSLYQYFPNKAAILFQLQRREWQQTSRMLQQVLMDGSRSPLERLRNLVHAFIRSECEEAEMRIALDDAAPFFREAPEAREARDSEDRFMVPFMQEALPNAAEATRVMAMDLITTTLSAGGKQFSQQPRTEDEIRAYADAMADMFCAYLNEISA
ncbi:TetR family transcriptional regulator [Salinicola peritrichatus]|uniref:TetR family transcriptional regulator n=1 Tax=Salinicola peritrichatus TaxID=1267424 RepID=UPI000DA1770D|nr:TetR family transcriptional regulator [Salinicola peritrichatus]